MTFEWTKALISRRAMPQSVSALGLTAALPGGLAGRAMAAEDVKFSFERIIDPATESTNKPDMEQLSHVEVTGEREGVIVLKEPFAAIWTIALPYITGNIISKKAVEAMEGKRIGTEVNFASGPSMHKEWRP